MHVTLKIHVSGAATCAVPEQWMVNAALPFTIDLAIPLLPSVCSVPVQMVESITNVFSKDFESSKHATETSSCAIYQGLFLNLCVWVHLIHDLGLAWIQLAILGPLSLLLGEVSLYQQLECPQSLFAQLWWNASFPVLSLTGFYKCWLLWTPNKGLWFRLIHTMLTEPVHPRDSQFWFACCPTPGIYMQIV